MVMGAPTAMITVRQRMSMPIDPHITTVMQWLSPAFPIGGFAYSHGLEWAIATGRVDDAATLQVWITDLLELGSARSDAILVSLAAAGDMPPDQINAQALALCPSRERVHETQTQGTAFGAVLRDVWGLACADLCLPVAIGAAGHAQSIPASTLVPAYLHGFCANMISAAVRLVPLGQTAGQRVLWDLHPIITTTAQQALHSTINDLTSCTFLSDVASMRHETLSPRIFKT